MPGGNEYYQNACQPEIDIYAQMETDLLENISDYLGNNKSLLKRVDIDGNTELILTWQAERLSELGLLNQDNAKVVAQLSGLSEKQINKIFKDVVDYQVSFSENNFINAIQAGSPLRRAIPIFESPVVKQIFTSAINSTKTTFNLANNTMLSNAGAKYVASVNRVTAQVLAGNQTAAQGITSVINKLAQDGITAFVRSNGSQMRAGTYAAVLMRTNTKNTVTMIQEQRAIEYGNNYIEINAYSGARPKCETDQGLIYSRDGNTNSIKDLDGNRISVKAWGNTSFGEAAGILGINCGHQRFDFIPEYSTQEKVKINQKENDTTYKEKQLQRSYERDVRDAKRRKLMFEKAGAPKQIIQKSQAEITRRQGIVREFTEMTGRTRRYARERVELVDKE